MRPDPIREQLERTRSVLSKSSEERAANATPYRPGALYAKPTASRHPWWYVHACARIARICEGARPAKGHSFESACGTATHPRLAHRFMETFAYYMTRQKPAPVVGSDHNPFRNLSDKDAESRWYAIIERICDASTGMLGTWRAGLSETGAARNRG